jgi:hypothetical protein
LPCFEVIDLVLAATTLAATTLAATTAWLAGPTLPIRHGCQVLMDFNSSGLERLSVYSSMSFQRIKII